MLGISWDHTDVYIDGAGVKYKRFVTFDSEGRRCILFVPIDSKRKASNEQHSVSISLALTPPDFVKLGKMRE